jgi:uncharacterized membrane protein YedE/YeeE
MHQASLNALQTQTGAVLALAFVLAVALGWLIQRSHFCTMGALSDWMFMRDTSRLRQWALALAVGAAGFGTMSALGWISPLQTIYALPRFPWLSYLVGGGLFGVGMVLASGCPTKNLVRLGGGSLKALVVLLVMGISALATMRGAPGLLRTRVLDPLTTAPEAGPFVGQWLASLCGLTPATGLLSTSLLVSLLLLLWVLRERSAWQGLNLLAGLGIGTVLSVACSALCPNTPKPLILCFWPPAAGAWRA